MTFSEKSSNDTSTNATVTPVPIHGQALSADELLLRAQGHTGELPRQFGAFATVSLAFSLTNSWLGISAVFYTPLICGGAPSVFYGVAVATVACSFITLGLAELASAYPSSGGQYQ